MTTPLEKEEKDILAAYDEGKMKTATPSRKQKEKIKAMAEAEVKKSA